jgi:hypothetical protein
VDDKRVAKSADQLAVGDWIAPFELCDQAAEVLFATTYPFPGSDVDHVYLVYREMGRVDPAADVLVQHTLINLAADAELADYREAAARAKGVADLRAFADFLECNPWAPMPFENAQANIEFDRVRDYAEKVGVKVDEHLDDRTQVFHRFGGFEYRVIAWHPGGRPTEPKPEPHPSWPTASELKPWESLAPEGDRVAAAIKPIDPDSSMEAHYDAEADPTGLAYTRVDDGADDPTPVSPARVPLHTGGMTDDGLVDETERRPLVSDETIAEAAAMEERDRAAGGPPWEVPEHPENAQPGGWHRGQIR